MMVNERDLQRMIDACRSDGSGLPDATDLADPALASLVKRMAQDPVLRARFERSKDWDAGIRDALVDVAVPHGLAERIMQRLAAETSGRMTEAATPLRARDRPGDIESAEDSAKCRVRRFGGTLGTRRRWLVTAGLAAAATLFIAVTLFRPTERLSPEQLLEAVRQFDSEVPLAPGTLVRVTPPPGAYPLSNRILTSPATSWSPVSGLLGRRGVAYRLHAPGGAQATLYVVKLAGLPNDPLIAGDRLPTAPPGRPQPASGGAAMATWQEKGRLYVLVVHGDESVYRRFIRPAQPIA